MNSTSGSLQVELQSVELCITEFEDALVVLDTVHGKVGANNYRAPEVTLGDSLLRELVTSI